MPNQPTDPQVDGAADEKLPEEKLKKAGGEMVDAEDNAYKGGDQDIDTAGTEADDHPLTRPENPERPKANARG